MPHSRPMAVEPRVAAVALALALAAGAAGATRPNGDLLIVRGSDLVRITSSGMDVATLTAPGYAVYAAAWARDGRRIAFSANPPGHSGPDLFVMNADGSGLRRLTRTGLTETDPTWSPDG